MVTRPHLSTQDSRTRWSSAGCRWAGLYDARMSSPDVALQQVVAAIGDREEAAYGVALRELVDAVQSAAPVDIEPALARLASVLRDIPLGLARDLARIAGSMAGEVADTLPVLGVLVE